MADRQKTDHEMHDAINKWHFASDPSPTQTWRGIRHKKELHGASNNACSLYIVLSHVTALF